MTRCRVKGIDGEFDLICRSLGLSGTKISPFRPPPRGTRRPASVLLSNNASRLQPRFGQALDLVKEQECEATVLLDDERSVSKRVFSLFKRENKVEPSSRINGDRLPALWLPPPMKFQRHVDVVVDDDDEILKSFATESDDECFVHSPIRVGLLVLSMKMKRNKVRRLRETNVVVESGPSISVHDHDGDYDSKNLAVKLIMEPVYNVSLNGKLRRIIMSWQKGELLGSGSFGTVYEGYME